MTDTNFPLTGDDSEFDDLPRTLRRERDRQAASAAAAAAPAFEVHNDDRYDDSFEVELVPATVQRFEVPFFRLMFFLIKAVLAAIPALLILAVILWFAGQALQLFFPELIQMKILISFPADAGT